MRKESKKFLTQYLNSYSPTGLEKAGQKVWMDYITPYVDRIETDAYGSAVAIINQKKKYKVVLEAHVDEISWFVNYIDDKGYIHVIRNGGSDHQIAPSKTVVLHGKKGAVRGIFGWPAIHVRRQKEEAPSLKNIFIDVGCSNKKEVEKLGIHVGTIATFDDKVFVLNKKYWCGRGLDNRMGGFMIAEVARHLSEIKTKIDFGVYFVNSVQEEIGLKGAAMMADSIKPNMALITDVCHDSFSPPYDKKRDGEQKAGDGPVIFYGPAVQNNVRDALIDVADKNKIPYQRAAVSRTTGTDTDSFAYSNGGVPSALVSLPLKYMHTTVETVHQDDFLNIIKLFKIFIANNIDSKKSWNYF